MHPNLIRKELAILRIQLITQGINSNEALNQARKAMNDKYGTGWREASDNLKLSLKFNIPTIHDEHTHGEHWMD